jgi:hypothetical protein
MQKLEERDPANDLPPMEASQGQQQLQYFYLYLRRWIADVVQFIR